MMLLPIYIFGALANALVNSINSRKQQALQERLSKQNLDAQRENLKNQFRQQVWLHAEDHKRQVANQLRAFALNNTWPLDTSPEDIADQLNLYRNMPLFLVTAPIQSAGIQKELYSIWNDLHLFFTNAFPFNSETPVIHGKYKANYPVSPTQDITKIFHGVKNIPTLYLAPYSTDRDYTLGVIVAFWGTGGSMLPTVQNFEIDVRKMYVDEIRKEAVEYRTKCDSGQLIWDDNCPLALNWSVFEQEKVLIERGNDLQYLDRKLRLYKTITASADTYISMASQILPVIQMFSSAVVDTYFVLEYGTSPRFPALAKNILRGRVLPDLQSRGLVKGLDEVEASDRVGKANDIDFTKGIDFANGLCESYTRIIATYADVDVCKRSVEMFGDLSVGNRKLLADIVEARVGRASMNNTEFDEHAGLRNLREQKPIDPAGGGSEADIWLRNAIICFKREDLNGCLVWAMKAARTGNQQAVLLVNKIQKVLR